MKILINLFWWKISLFCTPWSQNVVLVNIFSQIKLNEEKNHVKCAVRQWWMISKSF